MSGSNLYSQGFGTTSSNSFPSNPVVSIRSPTTTDIKGANGAFPLGQMWIDESTPASYQLINLTSASGVVSATWAVTAITSGSISTLGTDSGTATPVSQNIDIVGAGDISTAAVGDTITISYAPGTSGIDNIDGNTGSVAPVAGSVNILGSPNNIQATGSGDTLTLALTSEIESPALTAIGGTRFGTALGVGAGINPSITNTTHIGSNAGANNTVSGSTAVGKNALSSNVSGTSCTAVGNSALQLATGNNNTAVGESCLSALTSGINNVAMGSSALGALTTNSSCTAFGSQSLEVNTGGNNTAVGSGSMTGNITGESCTALGWNSLAATPGNSSTAVGASALAASTAGTNTAVGADSCLLMTTGDENTAIGNGALSTSLTGDNNTAVGHLALSSYTGIDNVGIGSRALAVCTTGGGNTAVGANTLNGVLTGISNVCIGVGAGSAYVGSESNNICIGAGLGGDAAENNTIRIGIGAVSRTFILGIRGIPTQIADAVAVLIDSAGQLGTASSSIRYKENVVTINDSPAGDLSSRIHELRVVKFKYKDQDSSRPQYGLIAEEVLEVIPEIVVNNKEGEIETVQYQTLPIFLLAEVQKLKKEIDLLKEGK